MDQANCERKAADQSGERTWLGSPYPLFESGMPIITSPLLRTRQEYMRRRTWKERLFTRPWHPFLRSVKVVIEPDIFIMERKVFMHPQTLEDLRRNFGKIRST